MKQITFSKVLSYWQLKNLITSTDILYADGDIDYTFEVLLISTSNYKVLVKRKRKRGADKTTYKVLDVTGGYYFNRRVTLAELMEC